MITKPEFEQEEAYRQAGWSGLHAVLLTALAGGHGLVGSRSVGLGAKGILGKFLVVWRMSDQASLQTDHELNILSLNGAPSL